MLKEIFTYKNGDPLDEQCPKCNGRLIIKSGKNGLFAGCINYPDCKYTCKVTVKENKIVPVVLKEDDIYCEKCGSKMVLKRTRRGSFFCLLAISQLQKHKKAVLVDNLITVKDNVTQEQ